MYCGKFVVRPSMRPAKDRVVKLIGGIGTNTGTSMMPIPFKDLYFVIFVEFLLLRQDFNLIVDAGYGSQRLRLFIVILCYQTQRAKIRTFHGELISHPPLDTGRYSL